MFQDNANPVSLSVEEIRRRNEERLKGRKKQKNMWVSDWNSAADSESANGTSSLSKSVRPGITPISELDDVDREEFDAEVSNWRVDVEFVRIGEK